ncbi:MAG: hypothetical protein JRN08_08590 [Nitrososphaerota archaeon]|nr:hypothetical protein [Nitrososphaerota archaeon]
MSSEVDLAVLGLSAAIILGYGYAASSAFQIRRRLSGDLYRKQGLGISLATVLFGAFALSTALEALYKTFNALELISTWAIFWGAFYWIDASIRAARLSDPLLRDTFHWRRLGTFLWAYTLGGPIAVTILVIAAKATGYNIAASQQFTNPVISFLGLYGVVFSPFLVVFFSGVFVLPLVARRSADTQLKRHLSWFVLYAATVLALFVLSPSNATTEFNLDQSAVLAIAAYFLYKSARSLVPIYAVDRRR